MRPVRETWVYRASQLSRPLGDSTTVTLCWLNTASCSWYARNSHRLKQTQAWNKQPCSSFPVHHPAPATSPVNPFHSAKTEEGITRLSLLLKPHRLVVQASLTSNQQHSLHFFYFFFLSLLAALEDRIYCTVIRLFENCCFSSLCAVFLNPLSIRGGKKKVPLLV